MSVGPAPAEVSAYHPTDGVDVMQLVRSLPNRSRELLAAQRSVDKSGRERDGGRGNPRPPTAIERLLCITDLVQATADHLERLAVDVRPLEARCRIFEPVAGYHRWDPDAVVSALVAASGRLAQVAEEVALDNRLPPRVRRGVALIAVELLAHVAAEGARQLSLAELALRSS